MTWNINGGLLDINKRAEVVDILNAVDIVAFSHTGHLGGVTYNIPGFKCISYTARPYMKKAGGVAVYAKCGVNVCMIKDSPEYGRVWFKIVAADIPIYGRVWFKIVAADIPMYACACYMPWLDSSYFKLEGGDLRMEQHWTSLRADVSKFGHMGDIIIMGDLNARTGDLNDRLDLQNVREWGTMCDMGVPVPTEVVALQEHASHAGQRRNRDSGINEHGKQLVYLCRDQGLLILNGRLPGDLCGDFTYFRGGNNEDCHSTIDYFIASPGLVLSASDVIRDTSHLYA